MCINFCQHVYIPGVYPVPTEVRKDIGSLETGVVDGCEVPYEF